MMIPSKPLGRRTLLRGLGAAMALPMLEAMVAPGRAAEAAMAPKRLSIFYTPNGMIMESFVPTTTGENYALSPTLAPLAPYRDKFTVITGLAHSNGKDAGGHARNCAGFLTGAQIKHTDGFDVHAGISMDQVVAKHFGQKTQLASLELGLEPPSLSGTCEVSYGCAYTNSMSWRTPTTPMPVMVNPRDVFERLFGDGDSIDQKSRLAELRAQSSILDFVMADASGLSKKLGANDRHKLAEYMDSVRDVERRIQKAESGGRLVATDFTRPSGVPATFEEHLQMMVDLQVLSLQADLTRVNSLMVGREISNRAYPEVGVSDAHHMLSHHGNDPEKIAKLVRINRLHMQQFAYFLKRMDETKEPDGTSLLDHTLVLEGASMGNPNIHDSMNLPVIVAGGLVKGNRHIAVPAHTPMSNLLVSLMQVLEVPETSIGDSDGPLKQFSV